MAPPLILRIIGDASSYFKTAEGVVSANTKVGQSALAMGANFTKAAEAQVAAGTKAIQVQRALVTELTAAQAKAIAGSDQQIAATVALEGAQAKLNRSMGLSTLATGGMSRGAQTAERDLGKLTRGALAGSGVISALGRSLAFASSGFIAVAGTATILSESIKGALSYVAVEKQVTAQLKTSGQSFDEYKTQIESALLAEGKLAAFSNRDLLQAFGYIVRVSGDVNQSLRLTGVAADVARGRGISLTAAAIALGKGLGGSATALRRLGVIVPKALTGLDAINYVAKTFAGQAEAGATSADHLHTSLVNAGDTIGRVLLPTFDRLATSFSSWLTKMEASGRLQRDANFLFSALGVIFHTLETVIKDVNRATGGFAHTIGILIALELGSKLKGWIWGLRVLAGEWGLVGAAATKAGLAQSAALTESGAAGAAGAAGGTGAGILAGGLLGRLLGRGTTGVSTRVGAYTAEGATAAEVGAGAGLSATGIGALGVAAILTAGALNDLAKTLVEKAGGGGTGKSIVDDISGALTGGLVGNSRVGHAAMTAGFSELFRRSPTPPPAPLIPTSTFGFGAANLFGPKPGVFGTAQPMQQFWKAWEEGFKLQMAGLQAALTRSSRDDIANAKKIVAKIKRQLDEGLLRGPALVAALQAEASALSTIWSAEDAAAQKRAAAAAAAKQKIITQIQNAIDPIKLEVALSRAQATGQDIVPALKALLKAAYKGLAKAIAANNQQLEKSAYDQITSLKQQIKDAQQQVANAFTEPMKLQIALARAQAFGGDTTKVLLQMKRAALKALRSGKYAGQGLIDLLNEIANINSQLGSSITNAYGMFKKTSVKKLTEGLGLTADQRRRLEARYSQVGPGGTVPAEGTGAAGYVIDPDTGRPVKIRHRHRGHGGGGYSSSTGGGGTPQFNVKLDLTVNIDGKQVEATVTKHQQRRRRHNPTQTRGPNAATSNA